MVRREARVQEVCTGQARQSLSENFILITALVCRSTAGDQLRLV